MTFLRLRRLFAMLCPSLSFTLPATVDSVFLFGFAGLVAALVEFMFPVYFLGSSYDAVAYHYPRVIIFYVPLYVVQWMNAFPVVFIDRWFFAAHASVVIIMAALAATSTYLENTAAWKTLQSKNDMRSWNRTQDSELTNQESSKGQGLTELHERVTTEYGEDAQHLHDERNSEEAKAARTSFFKALAAVQRREEHQTFVHAKENERLEAALKSTIQKRDAVAAAHRSDLERWEQRRATDDARYGALQSSLDLVTTKHKIHTKHCEEDRRSAYRQLTEQDSVLERSHKEHATRLATTSRLHDRQTIVLETTNNRLADSLASINAANDAAAASYGAHVKHTKKQLSTHEAQYTALEGSLAFVTAQQRVHMENCGDERAQRKSRIAELLARLDVERAARAKLQVAHDELKSRHATAIKGRMEVEAKLKTAERDLYFEKHQQHSTTASQNISDTLINSPTVKKRQQKQSLVGRPEVQGKELYQDQLILPSLTLFNEFCSLPQPDFVEGSSSSLFLE